MMKKWKGLLFGTMGLLTLAGCSSGGTENIEDSSAAEYVQAAHEMLEEADGFAAEFQAEVQMQGADKTATAGSVLMVKEPLYMNAELTLDFSGVTQKYDMYLEETEDAVNQYMSYDGEWTEMTMTEEDALQGTQIYNTLYNMEAIFSAAESWTISEEGKALELIGIIPEGKFYALEEYTRFFQLAGMSGLSEVYYAGVGDVLVAVTLDSKTGAPLGYEIDLAKQLETMTNNVLTELGGGTLENGVEVEKYTISSTFTKLGGVAAGDIPAAAKNTAINYEKEALLEK